MHIIHCGLVVSTPAWDGTGCEFDSWQCRIYIPCSLSLRLLGSFRGSLGTYGLTSKIVLKKKKKKKKKNHVTAILTEFKIAALNTNNTTKLTICFKRKNKIENETEGKLLNDRMKQSQKETTELKLCEVVTFSRRSFVSIVSGWCENLHWSLLAQMPDTWKNLQGHSRENRRVKETRIQSFSRINLHTKLHTPK